MIQSNASKKISNYLAMQKGVYNLISVLFYVCNVFIINSLEEITEEELRQYWLCCQSEFG